MWLMHLFSLTVMDVRLKTRIWHLFWISAVWIFHEAFENFAMCGQLQIGKKKSNDPLCKYPYFHINNLVQIDKMIYNATYLYTLLPIALLVTYVPWPNLYFLNLWKICYIFMREKGFVTKEFDYFTPENGIFYSRDGGGFDMSGLCKCDS